ncbi:hypothetical protein LTR10_012747 [Elasticomyces elasticus]|uniref:Mitochondrial zinc maintenance protein 1, mitochondrial n=1 Tax=Exophiala sideris TaxID=1016849 RepID=A0ABR0JRX3_9EURO|nr:hypothetical protein LTR10_012747 [Elasticomyces elasticus]KAK5034624.1 hypothetical protein LTR13_006280 [Exophiala sideris]KAK5040054.1 hypothetical protein LTS07_000550 [Exophiala sideris]KAK5068432.1 hypothetical protein LTR69_000551 [Exophiala sideris]KAK5187734.1 hypothetical protein LTR44_000551 [Eurotiomycetes sp. CCFEE 6388]
MPPGPTSSPEYSVEEIKDLRTAFIARLVKIDLSKAKYQKLVYANYDKDISQYRKAKNPKLTQAEAESIAEFIFAKSQQRRKNVNQNRCAH